MILVVNEICRKTSNEQAKLLEVLNKIYGREEENSFKNYKLVKNKLAIAARAYNEDEVFEILNALLKALVIKEDDNDEDEISDNEEGAKHYMFQDKT